MNALHLIIHSALPPNASTKEVEANATKVSRINKFKRLLQASTISLSDLRASAWSGLPEEVRAISWQVLLGYLPTSSERRVTTLERKRKEYLDGVKKAFEKSATGLLSPVSGRPKSAYSQGRSRGLDENVWHQISIDVPRTSPHIELYGYDATQRSLERILYLWAIRHPTSGYVQGINDLVTPFWQVFLATYITDMNIETGMDPGQLPRSVIDAVEADSYWCLTKLLDGIQDNYIVAQPGIIRQVGALRDLTHRIDSVLARHLEKEGVEFMQFSFRWMNCLLMREVNLRCTIRMWDTYMAEEQGFSEFHLYVCAAFLVKWTEQLVKMDFQASQLLQASLPMSDDIIVGGYDVSASLADKRLDRKGHRASAKRGIHMAESFSRLECSFEKFQRYLQYLISTIRLARTCKSVMKLPLQCNEAFCLMPQQPSGLYRSPLYQGNTRCMAG